MLAYMQRGNCKRIFRAMKLLESIYRRESRCAQNHLRYEKGVEVIV